MDELVAEDLEARMLLTDYGIRLLCQTQQPDDSPDAGGFRCPERLCCEPLWAALAVRTLWRVYREPLSEFYHDSAFPARLSGALLFLCRCQHADGTLDAYGWGRRQNSTVAAEAAAVLCPVYAEIARDDRAWPPEFESAQAGLLLSLESFLRGCGRALAGRPRPATDAAWTASVALLRLHDLFPDPGFLRQAQVCVDAGLLPDADGVFPGRSPWSGFGIDEDLLALAALTGDDSWYAAVRRHLQWALHNVQENGEPIWQFAAHGDESLPRKRMGGARVWAAMARHDHNGQYAQMAEWTARDTDDGLLTLAEATRRCRAEAAAWKPVLGPDDVHPISPHSARMESLCRRADLLDSILPALRLIGKAPLPTGYHITYSTSGLVRARDGKRAVTLMIKQANLLALHNRAVVLEGVRLAANLDGWTLLAAGEFEAHGEYLYRFRSMPGQDAGSRLALTINAAVQAGAVSLTVESQGPVRVPLQLEMVWRPEGILETADGRRYDLASSHRTLLIDRDFTVARGADRITVSGLPPMTQRYFDDALPGLPPVPAVRIICPCFSPVAFALEFVLS